MPELAEVAYYRKMWDAGLGQPILRVELHPAARIFRGETTDAYACLEGALFQESRAHGKNLLFVFSTASLGVHLGMTGELCHAPPDYAAERHDHLILRQEKGSLVLRDSRMFGRVRLTAGGGLPAWWRALPPEILSRGFTVEVVVAALRRWARSPLKTVLLRQEIFPGVGNWMADEILWHAGVHPATPAGAAFPRLAATLWRTTRHVSRQALRTMGTDWSDPPAGWLFSHRWKDGGRCPRCQSSLHREEIGGRITCWCPACQPPSAWPARHCGPEAPLGVLPSGGVARAEASAGGHPPFPKDVGYCEKAPRQKGGG